MRQALRLFSLLIVLLSAAGIVHAQTEDTIKHLPPKSIEVTAKREADLQVVDSRTVQTKPVAELVQETGSTLVSDALRAMSSALDIRRYGPLGSIAIPSFRGLPAEYTIIYRDGIRLTNEQLGQTDLGQLALRGVSRIELIPASTAVLLGGDAIGAAINLVSQQQDSVLCRLGSGQTYFERGSGLPENSYYAEFAGRLDQSLSLSGGASLDRSTGRYPFLDTSIGQYVTRENSDALLEGAHLSARWFPDTSSSLELNSNYFYADRGVPSNASVSGRGASNFRARQSDEQDFVTLRGERIFGEIQTGFEASYQFQENTYTDPTYPLADTALIGMTSINLRAALPISDAVRFYSGFDLIHSRLTGNTNALSTSDSIVDRTRVASYVALKASPWTALTTAASVRWEAISGVSGPQFLPQVSLTYQPVTNFTADLAYSRAFHAPTLNDLYWKGGGNPNLHSELANTGQIQVQWQPQISVFDLTLGFTEFYASIQDQILWIPLTSTFYRPININQTQTEGSEITIKGSVSITPRIRLSAQESYTWMRAMNLTPGSQDYENELPYSSPTRSLLIVTIEAQRLGSISLLARYRGHEYTTLANDARNNMLQPATAYDLTAMTSEYPLGAIALHAAASVQNLTDLQYEEVEGYPLPGRAFKFSLEFSYH